MIDWINKLRLIRAPTGLLHTVVTLAVTVKMLLSGVQIGPVSIEPMTDLTGHAFLIGASGTVYWARRKSQPDPGSDSHV